MGEEDALAAHRADVVLPMLVRRTTDEKSPVRRVALQVSVCDMGLKLAMVACIWKSLDFDVFEPGLCRL